LSQAINLGAHNIHALTNVGKTLAARIPILTRRLSAGLVRDIARYRWLYGRRAASVFFSTCPRCGLFVHVKCAIINERIPIWRPIRTTESTQGGRQEDDEIQGLHAKKKAGRTSECIGMDGLFLPSLD